MNILQKFVDMENYDICNKIYSYIGPSIVVLQLQNGIHNWHNINFDERIRGIEISFLDFFFVRYQYFTLYELGYGDDDD